MNKYKFSVIVLLFGFTTAIFAQEFAPKKGNFQASLLLGNGLYFPGENSLNTLLPANNATQVGIGQAGQNESENPAIYLNIGELNNNSITNMAGIEAKYFVTDKIDINLGFSMNMSLTPKRDFIEGDLTVADMPIPDYMYINAEMSNKWFASVGSNYYFTTKNNRIFPYLGIRAGYQMGWLGINRPYTGINDVNGDPIEIYTDSYRAGQMIGISSSIIGGLEYNISEGLNIGFELAPFNYNFGSIQFQPTGMQPYVADSHQFKLFMTPVFKLGVRF